MKKAAIVLGIVVLLVLATVISFRGSLLLSSAENGRNAMTRVLILTGADVDTIDASSRTPLYLAARNGQVEIVQMLINAGADVHISVDVYDIPTPAQAALNTMRRVAERNPFAGVIPTESMLRSIWRHDRDRIEIATALIVAGADPDTGSDSLPTLLHYASLYNSVQSVKPLLEAGADVNARNNSGDTPLHSTLDWQILRIEAGDGLKGINYVVNSLLDGGADIDAVNDSGQSPLHLSIKLCNAWCFHLPAHIPCSQNSPDQPHACLDQICGDDC